MMKLYSRDEIVDIKVWLGYEEVHTVEPNGKSGGLAVFWKSSVGVDIKFTDKNLIDMGIQLGEKKFFLSCIYGDLVENRRHVIWERISRLGVSRNDLWVLLGDFNAICHNGEKLGGPKRSENMFMNFNNMLSVCQMNELKSNGNPFTWGGMRGKMWIQCKLDRCFGNKEWSNLYPEASQSFLDKRGSDHRPVLVRLVKWKESSNGSFRFDKRFIGLPNLKSTVVNAWRGRSRGVVCKVADRIKRCRSALSQWKKSFDLNARVKISRLQEALEEEQSSAHPRNYRVFCLKVELMKRYREEEAFWRQKSKDKWLKLGDKNSKFFHFSVNAARSRNDIDLLIDENGVEYRSESDKGRIAVEFFSSLFTSNNTENFSEFFAGFLPKVTEEMNINLIKEVDAEEVKEAVFSINASSAPGPDGMNGLFFQKFWYEIGPQVTEEIKEFFEGGSFPVEWNHTLLCLIPKVQKPSKMTDLRPISLCSVYYKIISKILVKRLQPYLPDLVSPFQSAFVPERQIAENILVAHEIVHGLRTNKSISEEYLAIKSDMSKAYDRVEWAYVKALLEALGFNARWIQLVMFCISSVSFSVLLNNVPFGDIKPKRGLRQGDPLSPALFVLCTEGLSHRLQKAEEAGLIEGVRFSDDGPRISHLLFADDSLFLCKAVGDQASALRSILQVYGSASGQVVNLDKSSISFGKLIAPGVRKEIQDFFGIYNEGGASKYLGLPECFSGSKVDLLDYIYEKLKSRLSGWFARSLSLGGKEILLKAVALALPVYAMGCFKLPKSTLSKLIAAMAQFWWNSLEHRKKIHWCKWDKLCLPKSLGGLGFKDLESFNQALLAKQAWKILQDPECILSRFLKSRYFPDDDFMEAKLGSRPSFGWRSLLFGRELLMRGLRKEIGNGLSMKVWLEPWCDFGGRFIPWMKNPLIDLELRISDLLDPSSGSWNALALEENFYPGDIEIIKKLNTVPDSDDFWCWKHNRSGEYSVKSGYWLASRSNLSSLFSEAAQLPSINPLKEQAWSAITEPKIKSFMWRVLSDIVPVAATLQHRGMKIDQRCNCCGFEGECVNHVLFSCPMARQIWALSDFPSPESGFHQSSVYVNMSFLFQMSKNIRIPREIRRMYPWILWFLWKNRNKVFFEGLVSSGIVLIAKIREEANLWFTAQELDQESNRQEEEPTLIHTQKWSKPKERWRKCNVGVCWVSKTRIAGCAWVLRDHNGEVKMHSRRSFSDIQNLKEARLTSMLWAIESMNALRYDGILFGTDDRELLMALERPKAWPSFKYQVSLMRKGLYLMPRWSVVVESRSTNKGVFLIAQSATCLAFAQSYVAIGQPLWLSDPFENEKR